MGRAGCACCLDGEGGGLCGYRASLRVSGTGSPAAPVLIHSLLLLPPISVIRDASKRTGAVFTWLAKWAEAEVQRGEQGALRSVTLENVTGLAIAPRGTDPSTGQDYHSNLDYCYAVVDAIGMIMFSFYLDPPLFGVPVNRLRIWMVRIPKWLFQSAHVDPEVMRTFANTMMDHLVTGVQTPRSLDDFMLPETHAAVQREYDRCREVAAARARKARKVSGAWVKCQRGGAGEEDVPGRTSPGGPEDHPREEVRDPPGGA